MADTDNKAAIANLLKTEPALSSLVSNEPVSREKDSAVTQDAAAEEVETSEDEGTLEGQAGSEEPTEDVEEPLVTLTVQGQVKKVPLSEVVAKAQQADDYTTKTMKLADERKALESKSVEITNLQKTYAERLTQLEAALKPQVPTVEQLNYLAQQAQTGDARAVGQYIEAQSRLANFNAIMQERKNVETQQTESQKAERQKILAEQQQILLEKMPEFKDGKSHTQLSEYLVSQGIPEEDVGQIIDAKVIMLAEKARRYDDLMAKRPELQKRVETLPKLTKKVSAPSQNVIQRNGQMQALETLEKNGKFANAEQRRAVLGKFLNI